MEKCLEKYIKECWSNKREFFKNIFLEDPLEFLEKFFKRTIGEFLKTYISKDDLTF